MATAFEPIKEAELPTPLVSIVIPVFNLWDYTLRCLLSVLRNTAHIPHEVIVIDDASTDESREALPQLPGIRLIRNETNQGFAANNNTAASIARGKYLLFLNNDTEVHAQWLDAMLLQIEGIPDVAVVGSKLLFPDGTIQHAGIGFLQAMPAPISPFHYDYKKPSERSTRVRNVNAVTAACALFRKDVFLELGGFDERFRMGYEDVDLCLRVREDGHRIVYTPDSVVTHFESLSEGRFVADRQNQELLHTKWLGHFADFEIDPRMAGRQPTIDTGRAPITVIVSVHDQLTFAPPCLENIVATLGSGDELIIIDNGSVGAVSKYLQVFVATHASQCNLIRLEGYVGLADAWNTGVNHARNPYVACVICTWRVVDGWLDRAVYHLAANAMIGCLCAAEVDSQNLNSIELLTPIASTQGGLQLPSMAPAGEVESIEFLMSGVVIASRQRLQELLVHHADGVTSKHPQLWSTALVQQGLFLAQSSDLTAYRFNQVVPDCGQQTRARYLANVSNALDEKESAAEPASIIVLARDSSRTLRRTLHELFTNTERRLELIVVDDGSANVLKAEVDAAVSQANPSRLVKVTFLRNETACGFPRATNQGLAAATQGLVVVMNADVFVSPQWLLRSVALLDLNPRMGLVAPASNIGPKPQCYSQPNVLSPPSPLDAFAENRMSEFVAAFGAMPRVAGICMVMRRHLIENIGGFDPRFGDDGGDVEDFCVRAIRRGYIIALAAEAYVEHAGDSSQRWLNLHPKRPAPIGWQTFCQKWNHPPQARDSAGFLHAFRAEPPFDASTDFVSLDLDA